MEYVVVYGCEWDGASLTKFGSMDAAHAFQAGFQVGTEMFSGDDAYCYMFYELEDLAIDKYHVSRWSEIKKLLDKNGIVYDF